MIAGASEQLVSYVQRERVRGAVRWHRPERDSRLRRSLG
jgi:hypothetical protein